MIRILIVLGGLLFLSFSIRWFLRSSPAAVSHRVKTSLVAVLGVVLVYLTATGRLNWVLPIIAGLLAVCVRALPYLLRFAPVLQRLWTQYQQRSQNTTTEDDSSTVETQHLRMRLDHASGEISGQVIKGPYSGKALNEIELAALVQMWEEYCNTDRDSAALLESYLERVHGQAWREDAGSERSSESRSGNGQMTKDEAYKVLGLSAGVSNREVVDAHRRLIQKIHPDRGGSDYLAAKINQAKDILLGEQ